MAKQGDLVVEIGADIAPFVDEMRKASDQARQSGASIARSFKDGYKLAEQSGGGIAPDGFGTRGGYPGMEGYATAGGMSGPESLALQRAQQAAQQTARRMAGQAAIEAQWGSLTGDQETRAIARQNWAKAADRARSSREAEQIGRANFAASLAEDRAEMAAATGGGRGGGLARGIGQLGFAAQDFASVYAIGGRQATERALMSTMNNIQMLGMSFGPMGMAITSVAGALGSLLIPKLLATGEAAEQTAKAMDDQLKSIRQNASADVAFAHGIRSLTSGNSASIRSGIEGVEMDSRLTAREKSMLQNEYRNKMEGALAAGWLKPSAAGGFELGKTMWGGVSSEAQAAWEGLNKLALAIAEVEKKEGELKVTRDAAAMKLDEVIKKEAEKSREDAQAALRRKQHDEIVQRAESAQRIKDAGMTPFERAQRQLQEISDLQELLGPDAALLAGRIVKDFKPRSFDATNLAVSGGEARTASGFADIMKSIRQSTSSPELEVAKEQKALLERMLEQLRNGMRLDPPVQMEGI